MSGCLWHLLCTESGGYGNECDRSPDPQKFNDTWGAEEAQRTYQHDINLVSGRNLSDEDWNQDILGRRKNNKQTKMPRNIKGLEDTEPHSWDPVWDHWLWPAAIPSSASRTGLTCDHCCQLCLLWPHMKHFLLWDNLHVHWEDLSLKTERTLGRRMEM